MKSVKIKNKQGIIISDNNIPTDLDYFLNENISLNSWGKSERWILQNSESYDPSDVLETEERIDEITEEVTTWIKLKAEYTIEIEDLGSPDTYFKNDIDGYLSYLNTQMSLNSSDPQKYEEIKIKYEKILLKKKALSLLSSTDWTQTLDNLKIRGEEWVDKWGTYRVELRKVVNDQRDTLPEEIK